MQAEIFSSLQLQTISKADIRAKSLCTWAKLFQRLTLEANPCVRGPKDGVYHDNDIVT